MSLIDQFLEISLADPEPGGATAHPVFLSQKLSAMALEPAPIEPSWILSGRPEASGKLHSTSADGMSSTSVWSCTAGAFKWNFAWDETVHILSGAVRVTDATGKVTLLQAGDVAYFAAGTWATWEIEDHVKKIAFCRRAFPGPVRMAMKLKAALSSLLGRHGTAQPTLGALAVLAGA